MKLSAALIAGGQSRRFGRDKASLVIDGVPLWQCQVNVLRALDPIELFISGDARPEWGALEVVPDEAKGLGPIGGLEACLRRCSGTHLLVLAVDLPKMTAGFLRSLIAQCSVEAGVIPRSPEGLEPLAAIYPRSILSLVSSSIASGQLAMHDMALAAIAAGLLTPHDLTSGEQTLCYNVNTLGDLDGL